MIIKGKSRGGPSALAAHLGNEDKNERVQLLETKCTVAQDLRGALVELDAYAAGTRCEKPLYHAAISPEPPQRLTPEQRQEAIKALEDRLGLTDHARVVVLHEKEGREHLHVVWSRIDLEKMRSVGDGHNYRKHEEVARDLERRFGHDRVQGAHHEREGPDGEKVKRPDRTPSRAELRQEERTGVRASYVKEDVTAAYRASDGAEAFKAALEDQYYMLAQGDRRDFVIVDREGGIHSLARRIDGVKAAELREFMKPVDRESLPTAEEAVAIQLERREERRGAYREERAKAEEAKKARADARAGDKIEIAYAKGDGYVAQTRAALKDHARRQAQFEEHNELRPERPDDRVAREASDPQPRQADPAAGVPPPLDPTPRPDASPNRAGDGISDRMARILGEDEGRGHTEENDHEHQVRKAREDDDERRRKAEPTPGGQAAPYDPLRQPDPARDRSGLEISDRMARLLGGGDGRESDRDHTEDARDRPGNAPGQGRTRSRFE